MFVHNITVALDPDSIDPDTVALDPNICCWGRYLGSSATVLCTFVKKIFMNMYMYMFRFIRIYICM